MPTSSDPVRYIEDPVYCTHSTEGGSNCPTQPGTPYPERSSFADEAALENRIGGLVNLSKSELELREQQNGYPTLRAYLDSNEDTEEKALAAANGGPIGSEPIALATDGVTRADFLVGDALLSVLNQRGEVQIGGSIFKVTRDNVYQVAPGDLALLNQKVPTLSSPAPTDGDPRILVHPVETGAVAYGGPVASRMPTPGATSFDHVPGVDSDCDVTAGSNRMYGRSYISNYFFYSEAGVSTEWQRRKGILWWTYWGNTWQSGTLAHSYDGRLYMGLLGMPLAYVGPGPDRESEPRIDRLRKTLRWIVGTGASIRGKIHTRHSFSNSAGSGFCDTYVSR